MCDETVAIISHACTDVITLKRCGGGAETQAHLHDHLF
jgi:hypothetical protein